MSIWAWVTLSTWKHFLMARVTYEHFFLHKMKTSEIRFKLFFPATPAHTTSNVEIKEIQKNSNFTHFTTLGVWFVLFLRIFCFYTHYLYPKKLYNIVLWVLFLKIKMLFLHIPIFQFHWMSEAHQNESWKLHKCVLGRQLVYCCEYKNKNINSILCLLFCISFLFP